MKMGENQSKIAGKTNEKMENSIESLTCGYRIELVLEVRGLRQDKPLHIHRGCSIKTSFFFVNHHFSIETINHFSDHAPDLALLLSARSLPGSSSLMLGLSPGRRRKNIIFNAKSIIFGEDFIILGE